MSVSQVTMKSSLEEIANDPNPDGKRLKAIAVHALRVEAARTSASEEDTQRRTVLRQAYLRGFEDACSGYSEGGSPPEELVAAALKEIEEAAGQEQYSLSPAPHYAGEIYVDGKRYVAASHPIPSSELVEAVKAVLLADDDLNTCDDLDFPDALKDHQSAVAALRSALSSTKTEEEVRNHIWSQAKANGREETLEELIKASAGTFIAVKSGDGISLGSCRPVADWLRSLQIKEGV